MRTKFTLVAAIAAAIVGVLTVAGGAAAQELTGATDPQATNVPYVAWAGEQIRFQKCYPSELAPAETPMVAHFNVVNPLIDQSSSVIPTWEGGGVAGIGNLVTTADGLICASGTYYSATPGLADILLNVTGLDGTTTLLPKHDFIGIWLRMNAPTIAELPGGGDNGTGMFNLGSNGGEAVVPGIVGVSVSGTFPFAGRNWTFPGTTDWSDLAHMLATDTNPLTTSPGDAWARWDIHDNNALDEGHPKVAGCTAATSNLTTQLDAVDNCHGGTDYSRIAGYDYDTGAAIGMLGGSDVGPFDPLVQSTLLGNGVLDSFDVPMPAAQINLALTAGTGMAGPTGALIKADKQTLLSRDGTGATTAHNLYAPYYSQYIPATSRPAPSSGVDGPQNLNDVAGFQTYGLYDNWDILNSVGGKGINVCKYADGSAIPNAASGRGEFLSGTVYTDEHGMAEVLYDPNAGFTLAEDANGRCISFLTGPSTFTSNIQATAVYPYKKVAGAQASNVLTKTVTTASLKSLTCVPKGPFEAFCVETVTDPWGNPMAGVDVSFTANSTANANIQADAAKVGTLDTTDQTFLGGDFAQRIVQVRTGPHGMAGVVITDSIAADCVNVRAENVLTRVNGPGVSVFTDFNPATGTVCTAGSPVTPPAPGPSTPPVNPVQTVNTTVTTVTPVVVKDAATNNTTPVSLGGAQPSVVTKVKAAVTIKVAKFMTIGHTRYLGIQLKSTAKTAKVKITLLNAKGKVLTRVVKTVKTNKLVKVMKLAPSVHKVRVAPVA